MVKLNIFIDNVCLVNLIDNVCLLNLKALHYKTKKYIIMSRNNLVYILRSCMILPGRIEEHGRLKHRIHETGR
jgi:hypothetical protein